MKNLLENSRGLLWLGFQRQTVDAHERTRDVAGAVLGLLLTGGFSWWAWGADSVWLGAPMGASAVLLFAVPSSPLAQPWPVLMGNVVSATVGVLVYRLGGATPDYLQRHGVPQHPNDLVKFDCLSLSSDASQTRGWAFRVPRNAQGRNQERVLADAGALRNGDGDSEVIHLKPGGPLDCSDGQVLHGWCLAGYGIAWRSTWEVEGDIAAGRLVAVLEDFAAPPNGIYAVFPQRKHLPLRVRLWIDFLKHNYSQSEFWKAAP